MKKYVELFLSLLFLTGCSSTTSRVSPTMVAPERLEAPRIDASRVGIVLIDAQPAFWNIMHGEQEPVMQRIEQLLVLADITRCPLVATFEDSPERNGWLPERLEKVFPDHGHRLVKRSFDCCREPEVREVLESLDVEQVVLAGAETDVCVLQSALGLLAMGFEVFLLEDSVFTNEPNPGPALRRLYAAGVVPCTYKTFYYEMMRSVDPNAMPDDWRERLGDRRDVFRSPYGLKPSVE